MLKKIVVIGPESTGKSTLCSYLAEHYDTTWCPEYAREYLLARGTAYSYDDLLEIAKGQAALEDKYAREATEAGASMIFIDTDMYVMKVWCEYVFGKCHQFILDRIVQQQYDLYFLCDTDIPWAKDSLREYPDLKTRQILFQMYKDLLVNQEVPWTLVSGTIDERMVHCITTIEDTIQ
jgi:NadR type nicotinamide-nucleotide adenylyltransferase